MSAILPWMLVSVLAVVAWSYRDEAKMASRRECDMADAIAAEDGTVLEVLAKHGGKISFWNTTWTVRAGDYEQMSPSIATAWAECVKRIRVQEAIEAEERAL